jgi:hypothetical protein
MKMLKKIFGIKTEKPSLVIDPNAINTIGGKVNKEVEIPDFEYSPVVYLGCISKNEKELELLDFDFHIVCPIFLDLSNPIFFDYSDYKKPIIITENVETNFYQYFEDIPKTSIIEYKEINFSFNYSKTVKTKIGVHDIEYVPGEIGQFLKPNWVRDEQWPNCPKNGKKMKFLFQLTFVEESVVLKGQEILDKESIEPYLNFGGDFYVFYEPESKTVAYLIQYE